MTTEEQHCEVASAPEEPRWKLRVEEPTNRYLYYPFARSLVKLLVRTPITANQVTLVQPLIAAVAAYLITFNDPVFLVAGALVFELRSALDCVDGTLARAKKSSSPNGHALDALCDWLGVLILYAGIYWHFRAHTPPAYAYAAYVPMGAVIAMSVLQGGLRSLAADYFMRKYDSILEEGRDATVEGLRGMQRALGPDSPFFERVEAWIGRCQHLSFQHELFDVERTQSLSEEQIRLLRQQQHAPLTRFIARVWSISNGDFFIRLTVISVALGHVWMWQLQLFWATAGLVWIACVIVLNVWFIRRTARSDDLVVAR